MVTAHGLRYAYSTRTALDGIDFAVARGEIFGFLGPNGSGKSTLFRLLATLVPPQEGRITVLGHPLPGDASRVRRRLGVVFQSPSLDGELTVVENLRHHGHLHGLRGRDLGGRIDAILERFGLGPRADDRTATLSGGLRRRVEIAKALLPEPALLLLDEPSTGLDPAVRRDLWAMLEALRQDGVTVLLTTHFMEEGERCDRLALLSRGRIVATGEPAALEANVGGDVVTLETEDPEALARELADYCTERLGETIRPRVHDGTVRFERHGAAALLARLAEAFPGRIGAMTVARPTLEDVFLELTGHSLAESEGTDGGQGKR